MSYELKLTKKADEDIAFHIKSGDKAILNKILKLFQQLRAHPTTGIGHPEPLRYGKSGQWSRKIRDKHRLVYEIFETEVLVQVIQAKDHYNDK